MSGYTVIKYNNFTTRTEKGVQRGRDCVCVCGGGGGGPRQTDKNLTCFSPHLFYNGVQSGADTRFWRGGSNLQRGGGGGCYLRFFM